MPRTFTTGQGTGSDATKKIGVGASDDIEWFNFQVPFGLAAGQDIWSYNNVGENNTFIAPSGVSSGVTQQSVNAWLLNPSTFATLQFDDGIQIIYQGIVNVDNTTGGANTAAAGIGFSDDNSLGSLAGIQGTNNPRVAFVRDTLGQWYTSTADNVSFTENAIALNGGHTLRIEYDPANATPQARFYVDGVLVDTITTDVPNAFAGPMVFGIENANGDPINGAGIPAFAIEV